MLNDEELSVKTKQIICLGLSNLAKLPELRSNILNVISKLNET